MRVWCFLGVFLVFCFAVNFTVAEIKPTLDAVAPTDVSHPAAAAPSPLGPPAPCDCPAGSLAEGEDCPMLGFDPEVVNGGCNNGAPNLPTFTELQSGETVCGTAGTYITGTAIPVDIEALTFRSGPQSGDPTRLIGFAADGLFVFDQASLPDVGTQITGSTGVDARGAAYDEATDTIYVVGPDINAPANDLLVAITGLDETADTFTAAAGVDLGTSGIEALALGEFGLYAARPADNRLLRYDVADLGAGPNIDADIGVALVSLAIGEDTALANPFQNQALYGTEDNPGDPDPNVLGSEPDSMYIQELNPLDGTLIGAPLALGGTAGFGMSNANEIVDHIRGMANDTTTSQTGADIPYAVSSNSVAGFDNEIFRAEWNDPEQNGDVDGTVGEARDTDWIAESQEGIVLATDRRLNWTVSANFIADLFVIDVTGVSATTGVTPCGVSDIVAAVVQIPDDCSPTTVGFDGVAGNSYALFVAPTDFTGFACGTGNEWTGTYENTDIVIIPCDQLGFNSASDWVDDFEAYNAPSSLGGQGGWLTWDNIGPNSLVVDQAFDPAAPVANSGSNMVREGGLLGDSDMVQQFCDAEANDPPGIPGENLRVVSVFYFVPEAQTSSGDGGDGPYFLLLNNYEQGGAKDWSTQVHLNPDTNTVAEEIHGLGQVDMIKNEWVQIVCEIDLDNNSQVISYGGDFLGSEVHIAGTFNDAGGGGLANLECVDYFSNGVTDWYGDDWNVEEPGIVVGTSYIRGDCNGNATFDGLGDGLAALNFQFVPGTPAPACLAACDANFNNTFDGLGDGLTILNAQFVPGSPSPAAPWPMCGIDNQETIDALGCAAPPCPQP